MVWGAVASAGIGAAAGILGKSDGPGSVHPMDNIPDHLQGAYKNMSGQVEGLQAPEYYQGQQIAGQNQNSLNALGDMGAWGQQGGAGYDAQQQMMGQGGQMMGAGFQGQQDQMAAMQAKGPNQFQFDEGLYDDSMNRSMGGVQNTFDNGALQMQQNFDWNQLPGLNMANAMGEGQGSTKFGQGGELMQGMTNQNIAQLGSSLWQGADRQANNNGMTAGSQNLSTANNFDQNMVGNYGKMTGQGADMMGQGFNMGLDNMQAGFGAGQAQQNYDQSVINADKKKWDYNQNLEMNHLQNRMDMIPGPGQHQNAPASPSNLTAGLNGAQTGMGIYGAGKDAGWWGGGGQTPQQVAQADWLPGGFSGGSGFDDPWGDGT
jgi:hypothetical protein